MKNIRYPIQQITWLKIMAKAKVILPHLPKHASPKSLKVLIIPFPDYSTLSLILVCKVMVN